MINFASDTLHICSSSFDVQAGFANAITKPARAQAENKIAQFYSAMMLDVRFAPLADNMWDLRSRRTYNETHVDTSAILGEDEYLSDDEVEELTEAIAELTGIKDVVLDPNVKLPATGVEDYPAECYRMIDEWKRGNIETLNMIEAGDLLAVK